MIEVFSKANFLKSVVLNPTIFPDKTSQIWHKDINFPVGTHVDVIWTFESESELLPLLQLKDLYLIDTLYVPYLPYARQDKGIDGTFALKTFLKTLKFLLGAANYQFYDVHNEKFVASWLSNYTNEKPKFIGNYFYVFPDKGAKERYEEFIPTISPRTSFSKVRDQNTGKILEYKCDDDKVDFNNKNVIVVDDISDGGKTFELLGESIRKNWKPNKVRLHVSHAIMSKGVDELKKYYDEISCAFLRPTYRDKFDLSSIKVVKNISIID